MAISNNVLTYWMLAVVGVGACGCQVHIRTPNTPTNALSQVPTIFSIVPPDSTVAGGILITITGQNFTSQTTVTIDGIACSPIDHLSSVEMQCRVPSHPSGIVPVTAADPNGPTVSANFTYFVTTHGTPNFTVNLGGGISTKAAGGKGVTAVSSIGEPVQGLHQSATGVSAHSGIIGAVSAP